MRTRLRPATQAPLAADAAADLCHRFSARGEKACQAGAVVAAAFDRPHPGTWRVSISAPQRVRVAARLGGSRCLSDGPVRPSGAGKPLGRSVMSHAPRADRLLIKPTAGARPASPCTPGRFIPKARKRGLTPEESRTTRRPPSLATAPDGPTNRVSQTPEAVAFSASRRGLGWSRWGGG